MFITLEGPDGSGKSTQAPLLADHLRLLGYNVLATREPGGTEISDQIRQVLMTLRNREMSPRTETLLFLAARAQLVEQAIRPHLAAGGVVVCDRYADSTLAYQGYGHRQNLPQLRQMLRFATGGLQPDLTLLLDVDAAEGLSRRQQGGGEWNRLDDYEMRFHQRVRRGYLQMAAREPGRWVVIDACQPVEVVQSAIRRAVLARITGAR